MPPTRCTLRIAALTLGYVGEIGALETPKASREVCAAANWLCTQGRLEKARDVAGKWLKNHPDDAAVLFQDAYALLIASSVASDPAGATTLRKQAFEEATRSKKTRGHGHSARPKIS